MAKKKSKKTQKPAEWVSPPPSPKPTPEEPVPAVPASLTLSPETAPTDSTPDDSATPLGSPIDAKAEVAPVAEPAAEPASQEPVVEDAEQKEDTGAFKPEEKVGETPVAERNGNSPSETLREVQKEPVDEPKKSDVVQESTSEVPPEKVAEASTEEPRKVESVTPADDDWTSLAVAGSGKKKRGKKGKKDSNVVLPKTIESPVIAEAPEPPNVESEPPAVEVLESQVAKAPEPPIESREPAVEQTKVSNPPPAQAEELTVTEAAPPSTSSKKSKKKGKKSKDQLDTATLAEEPGTVAVAEVTAASEVPVSKSEPVVEAPAEVLAERTAPEIIAKEQNKETHIEPEPEPEAAPQVLNSSPSQSNPRSHSESVPEVEAEAAPIEAPRSPSLVAALEPPSKPSEIESQPEPQAPTLAPVGARSSPLPQPASSVPASTQAKNPPPPEPVSPFSASAETRSPPSPKSRSPLPPSAPEPAPLSPRSVATERPPAPPVVPPKLEAARRAIEEDRPPAPTPPPNRIRPRRAPLYDDDDDDDSDSALMQPRLRGEPVSRDSSRGSYPPSHARPLFASRVPQPEHYSNPPPPPAPPQYHQPRHYQSAAPPYYAPSHAPSHNMSQASGYSGYPHYGPPAHGPSPYQESWGHVPPNYGQYNGHTSPPHHDSRGSREYSGGLPALENGSAIDDGSGDAFSRIAQAIPDLHVLLASYRETHGQLAVREDLLRRAGTEQQEKLRAKDEEISTMKNKIANMELKHSTEANRLRLEVGNMEEQVKELKDHLVETEKFKLEAGQLKVALDAAMKSWESKYQGLEDAHAALEKASAEEIAKSRVEFEEYKTTSTTRNDAEKIALAIQFDKKLKEAEVLAESQRQEAAAAHVKEKDDLRSEHQRQQREREANFDILRKELEHKLGASQLDCEQALKREREAMEVWGKERSTLVQAHREDIESLRKSWEEQRSLLEGQHKKIKEDSDKTWVELHAESNRKAEESKALADQLMQEKEELLKLYNELKLEHEKEKQVIKSVASNLESEKSRLEKLMESYGDIAEIKSKGDTYYLVSFTQLQKQILDLASTHFIHLPVTPPTEDLQQIPSHLPSFLADTSSSRQLRSAYVAHTVSKLVTYRVFGPFLFSLGRRYDKADSLFLSMSNHIRDKSTRKEAIWRQQTLLAAFTSSGAKQRINTAAGTVVEEIVSAIKNFADPKEEEGIKIAVKRIVKLAAETWRFARLEREMISATMPAVHDEDHEFTRSDFWPPHRPEGTPIASLVGTAPPSDEKPKLLLRIFPVIYREPKHENFRDPENDQPDEGCIYHHGLALYNDADVVVQRKEELEAAGLPPTNAASPTSADFPPPLLPAPRTSLPPTPVMDKASIRSKSPTPDVAKDEENASVRPSSPTSIRSVKSGKTSIRSKTPPPVPPKRTSIRSKSSLSVRTDKMSVRSSSPPPPTNPSEAPSTPKAALSEHSRAPYSRPIPGPVDYETPRDVPPLPEPTELGTAGLYETKPSASGDAPLPDSIGKEAEPSSSTAAPPLPAPTESILGAPPASLAVLAAEYEDTRTPPAPIPAPTESAIIPPFSPTASNLPTPPHSRAPTPADNRPVSPLFAAIDEIDAISQRSRTTSSSRRSARSRPSDEDFDAQKDTPAPEEPTFAKKARSKSRHKDDDASSARRSSGYTLSTRSSAADTASLRSSDSADRPNSRGSRYMCESRSAAIKGLYPNSPLAGAGVGCSPQLSRTSSVRSVKKRSGSGVEGGLDEGVGDADE